MSRHTETLGPDYFNALYAENPDPWQFATSPYEREKYAATLAALPQAAYENALEVGCSIGILTSRLAPRCARLLALDVADAALAQARRNCSAPNVIFENRTIPQDWPAGRFDLIVFSEMLYYLDAPGLAQTARMARQSLRDGGSLLLVHYLGETNYPLTGDEAAEGFIAGVSLHAVLQERTNLYRIDVLTR